MRSFLTFVAIVACAICRGFSRGQEILTKGEHRD
jgi:hypothetical protein